MIEERRRKKIKFTAGGVIINGKERGYRLLKKYYRQYIGRFYGETRLRKENMITNGENEVDGLQIMKKHQKCMNSIGRAKKTVLMGGMKHR